MPHFEETLSRAALGHIYFCSLTSHTVQLFKKLLNKKKKNHPKNEKTHMPRVSQAKFRIKKVKFKVFSSLRGLWRPKTEVKEWMGAICKLKTKNDLKKQSPV